ncbi:MAG: hypothetical protein BWY79_00719 [Actinobacteria bacterium ADurb.Bin444]|nr:MAG: hypothetical protein BWY79_00719 [Actinobacteria bacterium ADurb.Bin444]
MKCVSSSGLSGGTRSGTSVAVEATVGRSVSVGSGAVSVGDISVVIGTPSAPAHPATKSSAAIVTPIPRRASAIPVHLSCTSPCECHGHRPARRHARPLNFSCQMRAPPSRKAHRSSALSRHHPLSAYPKTCYTLRRMQTHRGRFRAAHFLCIPDSLFFVLDSLLAVSFSRSLVCMPNTTPP